MIPPEITFDVAETTKVPEIKGSSFCDEAAKLVVAKFWTEYVKIYDTDDRQILSDAYHDMASMSMISAYPQGHISSSEPSKK